VSKKSGFALFEVILVTVAVGILAVLVLRVNHSCLRMPQEDVAKGDIKMLGNQIELFALDHEKTYPESLDDLLLAHNQKRSYIKEPALDPWGNSYVYLPGTDTFGRDYTLFSSGPDGVPGNDDDIAILTERK
jgi:type II secretion system protein G